MTSDEMLICRAAAGLLDRWWREHRNDEPQIVDGHTVSYMTMTAAHAADMTRCALQNIATLEAATLTRHAA